MMVFKKYSTIILSQASHKLKNIGKIYDEFKDWVKIIVQNDTNKIASDNHQDTMWAIKENLMHI